MRWQGRDKEKTHETHVKGCEYIIVDHNTTTYKQMQMRCKCSPVSGHLLTPVQVILTREPCVCSGLDSGECLGNNRKQPTMSVNEAALQSASNIKSFSYIVWRQRRFWEWETRECERKDEGRTMSIFVMRGRCCSDHVTMKWCGTPCTYHHALLTPCISSSV